MIAIGVKIGARAPSIFFGGHSNKCPLNSSRPWCTPGLYLRVVNETKRLELNLPININITLHLGPTPGPTGELILQGLHTPRPQSTEKGDASSRSPTCSTPAAFRYRCLRYLIELPSRTCPSIFGHDYTPDIRRRIYGTCACRLPLHEAKKK